MVNIKKSIINNSVVICYENIDSVQSDFLAMLAKSYNEATKTIPTKGFQQTLTKIRRPVK